MILNKRRKKKKETLYLLLTLATLLLCVPFVTALYDFTGQDQYVVDEITRFNAGLNPDDVVSFGKSQSSPDLTPLINDLDSDGTNEIIVKDGASINVYQADITGASIDLVGSYVLPSSTIRTSNIIIYDIDSDSNNEIIFHMDDPTLTLYILEFNGTSLNLQNTISTSSVSSIGGGETLIQCAGTDDCALFYMPGFLAQSGTTYVRATNFTSTSIQNTPVEQVGTLASNYLGCFPTVKEISVEDIDFDGIDEYVLSYISVSGTSDEYYNLIVAKRTLGSGGMVLNDSESYNLGDVLDHTIFPLECDGTNVVDGYIPGNVITPVSVYDYKEGGNLDITIAYQDSSLDDFKIHLYNYLPTTGFDFEDDYPETGTTSGIIISNIIRGEDDDSNTIFCVMGHDKEDDFISTICASEDTTFGLFEHMFFDYSISSLNDIYNLTGGYNDHYQLSHNIDADQTEWSDITSSYGVFKTEECVSITNQCDLIKLYEQPKGQAVVIPVDYENNDLADLVVLSETNLWYLDDSFTNSPASVTYTGASYSINPCIESIWKINTTLEVQVTPIDPDDDDVSVRVKIYDGTDNVQDTQWSQNLSSGTTFIFRDEFTINKTISNGNLVIMVRDVENQEIEETNLIFSVSTNGVEFGDCITETLGSVDPATGISDIVTDTEFDPTETDLENNAVTTGIRIFTGQFGLSELLIWIFIMVVVAIGIWTATSNHDLGTLGLIGFVEFLLIIFGAYLGFISIGLIITLVVISIIVIGLWLSSRFTGINNT